MDSLPCYSAARRNLSQSAQNGTDHTYALRPGRKNETTNKDQSPLVESSIDSIDREERNSLCLKCVHSRSDKNPLVQDSLNWSVTEHCKLTTCGGRIVDYLEKNKDDNYFEEFLLPDKVLSKFALVLGELFVLKGMYMYVSTYRVFEKHFLPYHCLNFNSFFLPFNRVLGRKRKTKVCVDVVVLLMVIFVLKKWKVVYDMHAEYFDETSLLQELNRSLKVYETEFFLFS